MRRLGALVLVAGLASLGACSSRTTRSVAEITLDVALPPGAADAREVWRRRFEELSLGGIEVRSARVTDVEGGAQLALSVASPSACDAVSAAVLPVISEAVTASARLETFAPSADAAEQVATALRGSLGARLIDDSVTFDVSHLREPGAVTVRGVPWEAVEAALPSALPPGTRALRDDADGAIRVWVAPEEPAFTGVLVAKASADAPDGEIAVTFTDAGRARLTEVTGEQLGGYLVLTVDGAVVAAPKVVTRVSGGKLILAGVAGDARELARKIAASALPEAPTVRKSVMGACSDR